MVRQPTKEPGNRRRICQVAVIAVLLLCASAAQGAEVEKGGPRKPAWKWSLDERLAARFDPEAIATREAERATKQGPSLKHWVGGVLVEEEAEMTGPPPAAEMIDGSKTPGLFLPGELFDILLNHVFPPEKDSKGLRASRRGFEEWAAALGFGRDLWDRLEGTTAPYLRLLHNEDQPGRTTGANAKREEDRLGVCRARAQALEAAEAEFGEEAFLRLLYEGVAPYTRKASLFSSDYQRQAEELRFQEGGCR